MNYGWSLYDFNIPPIFKNYFSAFWILRKLSITYIANIQYVFFIS